MRKRPLGLAIVPDGKARTRYFRIRAVVVVGLLLVCVGGFAGYFIPFNSLTVDVVEQNQKKNLAQQNRKLFQKIHHMAGTLKTLERQIRKLDAQKERIETVAGINQTHDTVRSRRVALMDSVGLDGALAYVNSRHKLLEALALKLQQDPGGAAGVPVIRPVEDGAMITARFGEMRDPFTGAVKRHYGVDFGGVRGTPVRATATGRVSKTEVHSAWGQRVTLTHDFGFSTVYAHLGSIAVRRGQRVERGDRIGTLGASGLATGPHLHYEVRHEGKPVDPESYFFPALEPSLLLAQAGSVR